TEDLLPSGVETHHKFGWQLNRKFGWFLAATAGKQPHYFTARAGEQPSLTMAGLWDEWIDVETKQPLKSCTMVVKVANRSVAEVHDRMPVLLQKEQFEPWLDGSAGLEILKPAANDFLTRWPVSKRVNSSRAADDDLTLIQRVDGAVDQDAISATMQAVARGIGNVE